MSTTFAHLGLPDSLVRTLAQRKFVEPFPVQAATIPDALAGLDVCGKAPTGSGKTLAFGLPVLARVEKAVKNRPRALILAPTRELAEQIKQELAPFAKAAGRSIAAIYGGVGYGPQKAALRQGVDILVATPGRLEDLIEQGSVNLGQVDLVVLDEADRMADMGFMPAMRRILDQTSKKRQTLLFSATLDGDVAVLSRKYQTDPVRHEAASIEPETSDAEHYFWKVQHHDRVNHTADVIEASGRTIVFTRTRRGADRLAKQLSGMGIRAVPMHGGRSQSQRNRALDAFSSGRSQALIATDVAARGIHVDGVESVIHYDPAGDHKDYLHRSGRTARAGAAGTVVSLVTGEQERAVRQMQKALDLRLPIEAPRLDVLRQGAPRKTETNGGRPTHRNESSRPAERSERPARHVDRDGSREDRPHVREEARKGPKTDRTAKNGNGAQSVYVANLPWKATEEDVHELFGRFGDVHDTTIITDRRTGRSKGFAFVDMSHAAARAAVDALHGSMLAGRDLTVRIARPRRS